VDVRTPSDVLDDTDYDGRRLAHRDSGFFRKAFILRPYASEFCLYIEADRFTN
jgi:hypothetical protein